LACFKDGCIVKLKKALEIIESDIVADSPRLTNIEGLKNAWKGRLRFFYNKMPKQSQIPQVGTI
jgi:hypothetical protein